MNHVSRRIVILALCALGLVGMSLVAPRMVASGQDGLAAAGTAAVTFLGLFLLGSGFAVAALVCVIRARHQIGQGVRWLGLLPMGLCLAVCSLFVLKIASG